MGVKDCVWQSCFAQACIKLVESVAMEFRKTSKTIALIMPSVVGVRAVTFRTGLHEVSGVCCDGS